ncbi:phage tail tube protein [Hyphococcus flavus]|uniref:Phage tail tube protein n=1 Tax=Hyphococcus flavus TaxID=1866326 RepID=A0AAE9ZEY2_9PROT|nr:phage tail tube protein [Hyphococcus flavus]WDI31593.1 phage tail tube protein [Hyphococcus flavus]
MTSNAINFEGSQVEIGQGNAVTVDEGADTFDEISEVKSTDGPGGDTTIFDVTHSQSTAKEKRAGTKDEGGFNVVANYIPGDTGQQSCQTARTNRQLRNVKVTLSDGTVFDFKAFCRRFQVTSGIDQAYDANIDFEISGDVTVTPA